MQNQQQQPQQHIGLAQPAASSTSPAERDTQVFASPAERPAEQPVSEAGDDPEYYSTEDEDGGVDERDEAGKVYGGLGSRGSVNDSRES